MSEPVSGRIIMCQGSGCVACPDGSRAAVTIVTPSGACLACCDGCARYMYGNLPQYYRILPLSEWYDQYEDAKASAAVSGIVECEVVSEPAAQASREAPEGAGALPAAPPRKAPREIQESAARMPPHQHGYPGAAQGTSASSPAEPGGRAIGRHRASRSSDRARSAGRNSTAIVAGLLSVAASWAIGIFLISWANHLGARDYTYDVIPWALWGAFFVAAPLLALALRVIAAIAKAAAAEHRRYREWKASLPPEQRMAVELAEAAAMAAAAVAMHEHHKRTDARLTSSAMGCTMPDGHTPRPSQRIASYRQQDPQAPAPSARDPGD